MEEIYQWFLEEATLSMQLPHHSEYLLWRPGISPEQSFEWHEGQGAREEGQYAVISTEELWREGTQLLIYRWSLPVASQQFVDVSIYIFPGPSLGKAFLPSFRISCLLFLP